MPSRTARRLLDRPAGRRQHRPGRPPHGGTLPARRRPPIDCFYVYPTISADPTDLSDLQAGPEEARITVSQVARFTSRCRLFVPVYRQISLAGLRGALGGGVQPDWSTPYADVRAAWRDYLRRDNKGRGVVLIGHSQGAIHAAKLLADEIEANPAQHRLLVSAIMGGHPGVVVPTGRDLGGDFKITPLCRSQGQTGCAVVFATYAADDPTTRRFYGAVRGAGRSAACVNPSAPGGGKAAIRPYLPRPPAMAALPGQPSIVAFTGQLQAECVADASGNVLRVSVLPGPNAPLLRSVLAAGVVLPAWGLHILDMQLAQGGLLDMVDAQTRAWAARPRP